jgi:hypothetical protein
LRSARPAPLLGAPPSSNIPVMAFDSNTHYKDLGTIGQPAEFALLPSNVHRISRSRVAATIKRAEAIFQSCFDMLRPGTSPQTDGAGLLAAQKRLIDGQYILNNQYRALIREKKRLIQAKSKYNPSWFKHRMATLDMYVKTIVSTIGVGKAIADGYAWVFYQDDQSLLNKHLEYEQQTFLPPGVGGIGEIAFVDKLQGFNGHLVLYHGITSFLRMGDVSFLIRRLEKYHLLAS